MDAGRQARSSFNLFARAAIALDDYEGPSGAISTGPEGLTGEMLSAVTFVNDYIQLDFNGQGFEIYCPIVIHSQEGVVRLSEDGFRDRLCSLIDKTVRSVTVSETAVLELDGCQVDLNFVSAEGEIVEPLIFTNRDQGLSIYITGK